MKLRLKLLIEIVTMVIILTHHYIIDQGITMENKLQQIGKIVYVKFNKYF